MRRHDLETFHKRLKRARAQRDDDAVSGEIETAHPGYQDRKTGFYVGNLEGVGRIY